MCHMSHVTCHVSRVTCHVSHVTCHMSHVTCHMSRVTCHMSHVTCHMSRVTCIYFFIFLPSPPKKNYRSYDPHRSRDLVSPVCKIFYLSCIFTFSSVFHRVCYFSTIDNRKTNNCTTVKLCQQLATQ